MILGWLRLGSIATYVSHPVMVGFCSAGEILIAISQLKYMLGIKVSKAAAVTLVSACESDKSGRVLSGIPGLVGPHG